MAIASASSALSGGTLGPADDHALLTLWHDHWSALQGNSNHDTQSEQTELALNLLAAHREPHRIHHGLGHLVEGLRLWAEWRDQATHPAELVIALWFRDAVYDTTRHDSEARSARWALDALTAAGVPFDAVRRIRDLVIATRPNETPANDDARLMVDIDMAVLGSSVERYDRYEADLHAEHPQMADFIYRRKRQDVLKALLNRPRLFHTDVARQQFEARARENIARTIARLQDARSTA
jgi:predicted metal-dependent HD superfamily phosphohydrolase